MLAKRLLRILSKTQRFLSVSPVRDSSWPLPVMNWRSYDIFDLQDQSIFKLLQIEYSVQGA